MKDIFLGRLVKAFGIRGELKFHPAEDFWEDVLGSKQLMLHAPSRHTTARQPVEFCHTRPHGKSYVVTIAGVQDRDSAEALVGSELFIAEEQIDVDPPHGYLPYQLMGMTAKSEDGEVLGELTSIMYSSAHDIYEFSGDKGKFLVPAVPEFVVAIDDAERTMILRPLPGLIED